MTNIKKILAIISAAFVLATVSIPAFAEESTATEETTITSTVEEITTQEEESTTESEPTSEIDGVTVLREDVTLETDEMSTKTDILISQEEVSVDAHSAEAEIDIEYAPVDEEIPNTGTNGTIIGSVIAALSLSIASMMAFLKGKKMA